jgi:hypothetical protein
MNRRRLPVAGVVAATIASGGQKRGLQQGKERQLAHRRRILSKVGSAYNNRAFFERERKFKSVRCFGSITYDISQRVRFGDFDRGLARFSRFFPGLKVSPAHV